MLEDRSEFGVIREAIAKGEEDAALIARLQNASFSTLKKKESVGGFEHSILTDLLVFGKKEAFWHLENKVGLGLICNIPKLGGMEEPITKWVDIKSLPDESARWLAILQRKEKIHSILSGIAYHTYFEQERWANYETLLFYAVYFSHTALVRGIKELGIFLHKPAARRCSPVSLAASNMHTSSIFSYMDGDEVKYDRLNYLLHRKEYIVDALKLLENNMRQYEASLKNKASTQAALGSAFNNSLLQLNWIDVDRSSLEQRVRESENPVIQLALDDSDTEVVRNRVTPNEIAEMRLELENLKKHKATVIKVIKLIAQLLPIQVLQNVEMVGLSEVCEDLLSECKEEKRKPSCTSILTSSSSSALPRPEEDEEEELPARDYSVGPYRQLQAPVMPSGYYNLGGDIPRIDDIERMEEYNASRQVAAGRLYNNLIEAVNNGLFRICLTWEGADLDGLISDIILFKRTLEELLVKGKLIELPKLKNTAFLQRLQFWCSFRYEAGLLDQEKTLDRLILHIIKISVETPKKDFLNNVKSRPLSNEQSHIYFELKRAMIALRGICSLPEPSFVPGQGVAYQMVTFAELNLPDDNKFVGRFAMGCLFEDPITLAHWHSWLSGITSLSKTSKDMMVVLKQGELESTFQECVFSGLFVTWKPRMAVKDIVKWVSSAAASLDKKFGTMVCDIVYDIEPMLKHLHQEPNDRTRRCGENLSVVFKNLSVDISIPSF